MQTIVQSFLPWSSSDIHTALERNLLYMLNQDFLKCPGLHYTNIELHVQVLPFWKAYACSHCLSGYYVHANQSFSFPLPRSPYSYVPESAHIWHNWKYAFVELENTQLEIFTWALVDYAHLDALLHSGLICLDHSIWCSKSKFRSTFKHFLPSFPWYGGSSNVKTGVIVSQIDITCEHVMEY